MTPTFKNALAILGVAGLGIVACDAYYGMYPFNRRSGSSPSPGPAATPADLAKAARWKPLGVSAAGSATIVRRDAHDETVEILIGNPTGARRTLTVDHRWSFACDMQSCTVQLSPGRVVLELDDGCLPPSEWVLTKGRYLLEVGANRTFFEEALLYAGPLRYHGEADPAWPVVGPVVPLAGIDFVLTEPDHEVEVETKPDDVLALTASAQRRHLGVAENARGVRCDVRGRSLVTTLDDGTWSIESMDAPGRSTAVVWVLAPSPSAVLAVDGETIGAVGVQPRRLLISAAEHVLSLDNVSVKQVLAEHSTWLLSPGHHWTINLETRKYGLPGLPSTLGSDTAVGVPTKKVRPPPFSRILAQVVFEPYPQTWRVPETVRRASAGTFADWLPAAKSELAALRARTKGLPAAARADLDATFDANDPQKVDDCALDNVKSAVNMYLKSGFYERTGWCIPSSDP